MFFIIKQQHILNIFVSQGSVETCLGSVGNFNSRLVTNFVPIEILKKDIENRPIFDKFMTLDKRVTNLLGHSVVGKHQHTRTLEFIEAVWQEGKCCVETASDIFALLLVDTGMSAVWTATLLHKIASSACDTKNSIRSIGDQLDLTFFYQWLYAKKSPAENLARSSCNKIINYERRYLRSGN